MVTEAVKPMADDVAGNDNGAVTDSRSLVDSLVASGALDPLFERIDGGQIALTGDGGQRASSRGSPWNAACRPR